MSVDAVVIGQCLFSHLGVFLISVKPLTIENTENKTTLKIVKLQYSEQRRGVRGKIVCVCARVCVCVCGGGGEVHANLVCDCLSSSPAALFVLSKECERQEFFLPWFLLELNLF